MFGCLFFFVVVCSVCVFVFVSVLVCLLFVCLLFVSFVIVYTQEDEEAYCCQSWHRRTPFVVAAGALPTGLSFTSDAIASLVNS